MKNIPMEEVLKSKYPFEAYLEYVFSVTDGEGVLDDDITDEFSDWLGNMDGEEYISHGNAFSRVLIDTLKK